MLSPWGEGGAEVAFKRPHSAKEGGRWHSASSSSTRTSAPNGGPGKTWLVWDPTGSHPDKPITKQASFKASFELWAYTIHGSEFGG